MFRLLRNAICLFVLLIAGYLIVSLIYGGDVFRQVSQKVEEKTEKAAQTADKIKSTVDGAKNTVQMYQKKIKKETPPDD